MLFYSKYVSLSKISRPPRGTSGEAQTVNTAGSRGVSWQSGWEPGFCPWARKRASFFSPTSKSRLLSRTLSTEFGKHVSSTGWRAGTVERALGFSDEKTRFPPSRSFQSMWRWTCKELSIHHGKCYSDSMSNLYIGEEIPGSAWRNLERLQGLGTLLGGSFWGEIWSMTVRFFICSNIY